MKGWGERGIGWRRKGRKLTWSFCFGLASFVLANTLWPQLSHNSELSIWIMWHLHLQQCLAISCPMLVRQSAGNWGWSPRRASNNKGGQHRSRMCSCLNTYWATRQLNLHGNLKCSGKTSIMSSIVNGHLKIWLNIKGMYNWCHKCSSWSWDFV